jgi:aspartyl-tRNA synthetase
MELVTLADLVAGSEFGVFRHALSPEGQVKGIRVPGAGSYSRKQIDELAQIVQNQLGAKGLAWMAVEAAGPLLIRQVPRPRTAAGHRRAHAGQPGDLLLFRRRPRRPSWPSPGPAAGAAGRRLGLRDDDVLALAWIVDFPLFEWNERRSAGIPATTSSPRPCPRTMPLLETDPGAARGPAV